MAETTQEQTTTTTEEGVSKTIVTAGESTETETTDETIGGMTTEELLNHPLVKAENDRRANQAAATATKRMEEKLAEERTQAERRETERKIRDEGDKDKIAKMYKDQATTLQSKLDRLETEKTVAVVLDGAGITNPVERKILSKLNIPIDELPAAVAEYVESKQPALEAAVAAKLDTGRPAPQINEKPVRQGDLAAQLAAAEAKGPEGRKEATRIRNLMADENSRRASLI